MPDGVVVGWWLGAEPARQDPQRPSMDDMRRAGPLLLPVREGVRPERPSEVHVMASKVTGPADTSGTLRQTEELLGIRASA